MFGAKKTTYTLIVALLILALGALPALVLASESKDKDCGCEDDNGAEYYKVVAASGGLKMYSQPSSGASVVATLPGGASCVEGAGGFSMSGGSTWISVKYKGAKGWVSSKNLKKQKPGECKK